MVCAHQGDQPLTTDAATLQMKEAWTRENERKVAAWNTQLEQDQAEQAEQDRQAREEEEVQRVRLEREAEEECRDAEKKKPKLNPFDLNCFTDRWIEARPASYALEKINKLEYVELDYFTLKGCKEAVADTSKSISHDTMAFAQVGDTIAIRPLSALRPSKNIRNDKDLSWEEMLDAKNTMLQFMAKSGNWPVAHAESLTAFFVNLEIHPRKQQVNGKKALIVYQSQVRREWFNTLKRNDSFNIEPIQNELLCGLAEELNNTIREKENAIRDWEFEQVRVFPASPS